MVLLLSRTTKFVVCSLEQKAGQNTQHLTFMKPKEGTHWLGELLDMQKSTFSAHDEGLTFVLIEQIWKVGT